MSSVTERIKEIEQPYGGYLKLSEFEMRTLKDEFLLNDKENVHGSMDELIFGVFIVLSIVIEAFHAPISDLIFALADWIRSKSERK